MEAYATEMTAISIWYYSIVSFQIHSQLCSATAGIWLHWWPLMPHQAPEWGILWSFSHGKTRYGTSRAPLQKKIFFKCWKALVRICKTILALSWNSYPTALHQSFKEWYHFDFFRLKLIRGVTQGLAWSLLRSMERICVAFFNVSRLCTPAQMAFSPCSGSYVSQWQFSFAALCLPVPVQPRSQTWPCTGKEDYLSLDSDLVCWLLFQSPNWLCVGRPLQQQFYWWKKAICTLGKPSGIFLYFSVLA